MIAVVEATNKFWVAKSWHVINNTLSPCEKMGHPKVMGSSTLYRWYYNEQTSG